MTDQNGERQLALQRTQMWLSEMVPVVVALIAVWGVTRTIADSQRARDEAAAQEAQALEAQTLAESGSAACSFGEDFWTEVPTFEEAWGSFDSVCDGTSPSPAVQRELIQQLIEHPDQRDEILAVWRTVYPLQGWVDQVEHALQAATSPARS